MSSKFGFRAFQAEVNRRKNRKIRFSAQTLVLLLISIALIKNYSVKPKQSSSTPKAKTNSTSNSYQPTSRFKTNFTSNNQAFWTESDQLNFIDSLSQVPTIPIPETKVLKGVNLQSVDTNSGGLRIFLREPKPEENSGLKKNCKGESTNHYWLQLVDYDTNQPITTAFIRAQEMLELYLPVGTYKMRFAAGTAATWRGETELFGKDYLQEMVDKQFTDRAAKIDVLPSQGLDIGVFCSSGSLIDRQIPKEEIQLNP